MASRPSFQQTRDAIKSARTPAYSCISLSLNSISSHATTNLLQVQLPTFNFQFQNEALRPLHPFPRYRRLRHRSPQARDRPDQLRQALPLLRRIEDSPGQHLGPYPGSGGYQRLQRGWRGWIGLYVPLTYLQLLYHIRANANVL